MVAHPHDVQQALQAVPQPHAALAAYLATIANNPNVADGSGLAAIPPGTPAWAIPLFNNVAVLNANVMTIADSLAETRSTAAYEQICAEIRIENSRVIESGWHLTPLPTPPAVPAPNAGAPMAIIPPIGITPPGPPHPNFPATPAALRRLSLQQLHAVLAAYNLDTPPTAVLSRERLARFIGMPL